MNKLYVNQVVVSNDDSEIKKVYRITDIVYDSRGRVTRIIGSRINPANDNHPLSVYSWYGSNVRLYKKNIKPYSPKHLPKWF